MVKSTFKETLKMITAWLRGDDVESVEEVRRKLDGVMQQLGDQVEFLDKQFNEQYNEHQKAIRELADAKRENQQLQHRVELCEAFCSGGDERDSYVGGAKSSAKRAAKPVAKRTATKKPVTAKKVVKK